MSERVTLVGLDFGTTTSCAVIASAMVRRSGASGRMQLDQVEQQFQSEQVFTPFINDRIDEAQLTEHLNEWLAKLDPGQIFGGGAMITGLAAQRSNAAGIVRGVRRYLKDAIVAVAEDPRLESWLAFMGNSADLSRVQPEINLINLDIGGGTTNLAWGKNGEVLSTGSLFIGARHVQFEPGSYRIVRLSPYAERMLSYLKINKAVGDQLDSGEVSAVVALNAQLLEAAVRGTLDPATSPLAESLTQASFTAPAQSEPIGLTLSGGVGQLVYDLLQGRSLPDTNIFGDLGIDMARFIAQSPWWKERLQAYLPQALGRATVFGLLRYSTQVSGSTIFVSRPDLLPLADLVILGSLSAASPQADVDRLVDLAGRTTTGGCIKVELPGCGRDEMNGLALKIRRAIAGRQPSLAVPLVLLLRENIGRALGQAITEWGKLTADVVVVDEIDHREGQFAQLGAARHQVVPVSFYGMNQPGGVP